MYFFDKFFAYVCVDFMLTMSKLLLRLTIDVFVGDLSLIFREDFSMTTDRFPSSCDYGWTSTRMGVYDAARTCDVGFLGISSVISI